MEPGATLMWWDGYKWWLPVFNLAENSVMFYDTGVGLPCECEARFKFNPNAEEFVPGGGSCSDKQCPTDDDKEAQVTRYSPLFFCSNLSTISEGDESGYDYENRYDSEDSDSDGGPIVTIGSKSEDNLSKAEIASSPKSDSGSSGIGISELNPEAEEFIPRYWNQVYWNQDSSDEKCDGEAEKSKFTCHHEEFLIGVEKRCPPQPAEEELKRRPEEQAYSSWESTPNAAGNDLNGDVIPMYRVDTSQAMQIEGLGASTFDYISSSPSKDGIPLLVTPEIDNVYTSLAKLPEPFRVVYPTPDTPYTRVYALGGFELASPFPPTPNAVPKVSIDSYLALNPGQQQGYKPSYGLIGFGTDPSLCPPSFSDKFNFASQLSSSTEVDGGDGPIYDLVYGVVGYVNVPN